jgi:hypothetical protein
MQVNICQFVKAEIGSVQCMALSPEHERLIVCRHPDLEIWNVKNNFHFEKVRSSFMAFFGLQIFKKKADLKIRSPIILQANLFEINN